jgi:hypothetical protein
VSDKFDIDFKLLPPELQMKLWVLALDADTGKVSIAYKPGSFTTSLAYNYGGNLQASFAVPRLITANLGVNPSSGDLSAGLVYRGFNFGANASVVQKSGGASLSYGLSLLPYPDDLSKTFNAANGGLMSMAGDIASAPNNPLSWYKLHSNDVSAVTQAVAMGQAIQKSGVSKDNFGFGARINYSAASGFTIYGGAIWRF